MHDLRRTCATRIVQLGFPWTVADAVLGHAVKGTARHYVHAAPLPEMSRALEAWSRRLSELVSGIPQEGADVVSLRRA
jgi:integrase